MHEWALLAEGRFTPAELQTSYQPTRASWPPEVQRQVRALWERRRRAARRAGRAFFNGSLFRQQSWSRTETGLALTLTNTDYREYVAARAGLLGQQADPLGVSATLITADGCILVGRRQGVDAYVGRYDVTGGFVDRKTDWLTVAGRPTPDPFGCMMREVQEETGIALDREDLICLGLVYDSTMPHPTLCFAARLALSFPNLATLTIQEQETAAWEPVGDDSESLAAFLVAHHGNLSPTGEAALTLWGTQAYGQPWREALVAAVSTR